MLVEPYLSLTGHKMIRLRLFPNGPIESIPHQAAVDLYILLHHALVNSALGKYSDDTTLTDSREAYVVKEE